jgi:hypothetical protein
LAGPAAAAGGPDPTSSGCHPAAAYAPGRPQLDPVLPLGHLFVVKLNFA